jgi:hypothetical protein
MVLIITFLLSLAVPFVVVVLLAAKQLGRDVDLLARLLPAFFGRS